MISNSRCCIHAVCSILVSYGVTFSLNVMAAEYSIKSNISTRAEYNDNIFVTTVPHDGVSNISITPSASIVAKESNWETYLTGKLKSNNYSESNLNSDDAYLNLSSTYTKERNIYTLSAAYDKDSNLNSESTDFGISGNRINRKTVRISPQYQRLLTERLMFSTSYSHADVDYIDAANASFVPYATDTVSGSFIYSLTERDRISFVLQATDYASKDEYFKYQLYISRAGIEHNFSEVWSSNLSLGISRRNSTNITFQPFDFFGQPGALIQSSDFTDRGFVVDAGLTKKLEAGSLNVTISRDDVANSFGGLNEVSTLSFKINQNITPLWQYYVTARYEQISAVSEVQRSTNRDTVFIEPRIFYKITPRWTADAAYRYIQRKFDSGGTGDQSPYSNTIFISMVYNFSDISTF